jgi:nucleoid DNA-binding protein
VLHVANQIKTTSPKLIEAVKVAHFNPGKAFYSYYYYYYYYIYCC